MTPAERSIFSKEPRSHKQVTEKVADPSLQGLSIEIDVNGAPYQVPLIPANLRYTVYVDYFDQLSRAGGKPTGETMVSTTVADFQVIPTDMPLFSPALLFRESRKEGFTYRVGIAYNGINPHALKKGFAPRVYIVQGAPFFTHIGQIECEFDRNELIYELGYDRFGYALEDDAITRFAHESGLTAQNDQVSKRVASVETHLSNLPFFKSLFEIGESTLVPFGTNLSLVQHRVEDLNQTQESRNLTINSLNNFMGLCMPYLDANSLHLAYSPLDVLSMLPKEMAKQIDQAYAKYVAAGIVGNILQDLPTYVFVKPENIRKRESTIFPIIARSIQAYYDQLGEFPDLHASVHYEQIWKRGLETYWSSRIREDPLSRDHREAADKFGVQVIGESMAMIAA